MFRKSIAAVLSAMLVLLCTACDQNREEINATGENTSADTGVHVQILNVEVNEQETVLHVLWSNDTSDSVLYGETFGLQRWEQDRWINCPMRENTGFITVGYMLQPGKSVTKTYALNWAFGELAAGYYRFITSCTLMQDGNDKSCTLSAEFNLDDSLENSADSSVGIKLHIAGEVVTLNMQQSKTVCDALSNLSFDKNKSCSCQPEYQFELPNGDVYGIHLEDGSVCFACGQSELGKQQLVALTSIIDWALEETKAR